MLTVAPAAVALAQDRPDPTPRAASGGVYRRLLGSDPATLDPGRINDLYGRAVVHQIFDGLVYAWYADVPDADNFLHKLFYLRSPRNLTGYANPLVDALLPQARAERDLSRRIQIHRRADQIVVDEAPVVLVWHYTYERLFQSYVQSVEVNGLGDA